MRGSLRLDYSSLRGTERGTNHSNGALIGLPIGLKRPHESICTLIHNSPLEA
jgi:hypothetical protein